ncbi:DMT family transporter [Alcaligenes sp. SDU_A2]|uniref:DMT family transporter n=1 Tax=Alcaligenes sp. SDU_A2 TaxID=3136634 RepID=UPI002D16C2B8|nr:DMT family transporter [Alcaligenes sp.]HRL26098.1 DMT family transporter [Alcaligenes sp.]
MSPKDLRDLFLLAAIWGSSFLFTLKAVPAFGPFPLTVVRVGASALALMTYLFLTGRLHIVVQHWKPICGLGILNAAIPFSLYAYAALRLESGLLAVLNAMAPLFGALVARMWLKERLSSTRILGLCVGFLGILILVYDKLSFTQGAQGWAVLASVAATVFYGIATNYTARFLRGVQPQAVAAGSLAFAALALLPLALIWWPQQAPSLGAWGAALSLSLLCTAVAYLIFYRLLANVGPSKTITVTFLVPPFGVLWGTLLLDETLTVQMLAGMATVLLGTLLATGVIGQRRAA